MLTVNNKEIMKYFIIITFIFSHSLVGNVFSQIEDSSKVYQYFEVDQLPQFNHQNKNLSEYILDKFTWPQNLHVNGEIIVSFIVNHNGKVENIRIVNSLGSICDEYSKSLFEDIPNFEPGKINSKSVKVRMFFPIKFVLK